MIICHCACVNERQVQEAIEKGYPWDEIVTFLGIGKNCGSCQDYIKGMVKELGQ